MFRPGDKIGPYSLIQKIGRGASGEVWLSERRTIIGVSTQVALKIIPLQDEMELATIKQEANLWERANGHPNVVSITEADIYDGYVVITSEYVQDGSLADWLNRHGRKELDIQTAVNIVSGILNGLAHLHAQNIVHRDIKPANILMDGNTPRVTDFGVSRLFSSTIQSNHISGTTAYMSPEALEGWYSPQVDVWSAGVILYRLLVGYLPFQGPTDQAVMYKISHGKPAVIPSSITAQLGEIITCSLQRDLERRYKSAAEMRQALIEVSSRLNVSTSRQTNLPTITDPSSSSSISATGLDADELDDHTREAQRPAFEVATDISLELRAAGMEVRHRSEELRQCVEANCAERSSVEAELAVRAVIPPAQAEKDAATTPDEKRSEERRVGKECRSRWS